MRCASIDTDTGAVFATQAATCTGSEFVLLTQSELDTYTASPFRMSVADGAVLSGLIIAVWVAAFIARALVRSLFSDASSET